MRQLRSESTARVAERSAMQRDFIGYLLRAGRGHDAVRLGEPGSVLVVAPELVRTVLVTRVHDFRKSLVTRVATRDYVQGGVILAEGNEHARQRRLLQPAFTAAAVEALGPGVLARVTAEIDAWVDGEVIDLDARMAALALGVVSEALFGVDTTGDAELFRAIRSFELTLRERLETIPWTGWSPGHGRGTLRASVAAAHRELTRSIAARRARGQPGTDLLGLLMQAMDVDDRFSEQELLDQCVTLFFAGHGTTSRALAWTVAVLAREPAAWARAEAEARGGGHDLEANAAFPFLDRVLLEAMRLYPPAWLLDREALVAMDLGPVRVEPGDTVLCCSIVTQRDPRFWTDPERFDPDRWLPGGEAQSVHRLAYYPFSAGPRTCPGKGLALLEARLVLAYLLRSVRLDHEPPDRPLRLRAGVTMSAWGGMPMRVRRLS